MRHSCKYCCLDSGIIINLMDKSVLLKETQNIQKEGFLHKQSRFLKSWRQRWVVLTPNFLLTFKERREYGSPTEVILLKQIVSVKSAEEQIEQKNSFKVENNQTTFYFSAETAAEKEYWVGAIGKAMVKTTNMHYDD